jgi:predicted nucleic acid-binding protein
LSVAGFLLDTNVLSEFARALPADLRVDRWLKATTDDDLFASVLTFAEIRRGIELLPAGKRRTQLEIWQADIETSFASRLLPVTKAIGDQWAILSAQAQRRGTPLAIIPKTAVETPAEESSSSDASVCHNGSCNLLGELRSS